MNLTSTPEYIGDITIVLKRLMEKLSSEHNKLWEEYQQLQREGNYKEANDVFNKRTGVTRAQRLVLDEWEMILHPERRLPKQLEFEGLRVLDGGLL